MLVVQQILFILAAVAAVGLFARKVGEIRRNILLGKEENYRDHRAQRWKNVVLLAFGQKKMFRNPLVAIMHFVIYAGFIIINIEVLEIFLDGVLGSHRLFAPPMGYLYNWLINGFEFLAVGVIIVCIAFLARRNIIKLSRFISHDLDGWPRSDANYILITEIILMCLFLTLNASDTLLQQRGFAHYAYHLTGNFSFSKYLHPLLNGLSTGVLAGLERTCWWLPIHRLLSVRRCWRCPRSRARPCSSWTGGPVTAAISGWPASSKGSPPTRSPPCSWALPGSPSSCRPVAACTG
jgi:hypothetical protein